MEFENITWDQFGQKLSTRLRVPVFVYSCVSSGLKTGPYPIQGVKPTVYKFQSCRLILKLEQDIEPNPPKEET